MPKLRSPYGRYVTSGDKFIKRYKEELTELCRPGEVLDTSRAVHERVRVNEKHSIAKEVKAGAEAYESAGYAKRMEAFRVIMGDFERYGLEHGEEPEDSRRAALESVYAFLMMVEVNEHGAAVKYGVREAAPIKKKRKGKKKAASSGKNANGKTGTKAKVDAVNRKQAGQAKAKPAADKSARTARAKQTSTKPTANKKTRHAHTKRAGEKPAPGSPGFVKKCSNCVRSRNSEYCNQWGVCEEWAFAGELPDYWPTHEDMQEGIKADMRQRRKDSYF